MDVWLIVLIAVAVVLASVLWLRLHAFVALLLAGVVVALLTPAEALYDYAIYRELGEAAATEFAAEGPIARLTEAFGETAAKIGILIALASIVGGCLLDSGAASVIVRRSLLMVHERLAPIALAGSAFLLSIPVFFDTVFYLLVPIAKQLRLATGRNYVFYIMAIFAGGSIAHSLVPPTPGPLFVAAEMNVSLITMIVGGGLVGLLSNCFSLPFAWWINRRVDVPLRIEDHEREIIESASEATGPPLSLCLLPIIVPVILIACGTAFDVLFEPEDVAAGLLRTVEILSDKNVALGVAAALGLLLLRWAPKEVDRGDVIGRSLSSGGVIILITSAGGAFGAMLRQAGIAEALADLTSDVPGLLLLVVAFGLTTAIRTLQGSATVSMMTAAGVLQGFVLSDSLPYHNLYLALAIGAGSKPVAWMTDSGFWIICKMSGMTESEGLRTVSPVSAAMGLAALFWVILGAWLIPLK